MVLYDLLIHLLNSGSLGGGQPLQTRLTQIPQLTALASRTDISMSPRVYSGSIMRSTTFLRASQVYQLPKLISNGGAIITWEAFRCTMGTKFILGLPTYVCWRKGAIRSLFTGKASLCCQSRWSQLTITSFAVISVITPGNHLSLRSIASIYWPFENSPHLFLVS